MACFRINAAVGTQLSDFHRTTLGFLATAHYGKGSVSSIKTTLQVQSRVGLGLPPPLIITRKPEGRSTVSALVLSVPVLQFPLSTMVPGPLSRDARLLPGTELLQIYGSVERRVSMSWVSPRPCHSDS